MLRHMLKLVWKRKTRNLMLSLEILLAFVIVFAVFAFALRSAQLYAMPLGYHYDNAWSVRMERADRERNKLDAVVYEQMLGAVRSLPEVEAAAFVSFEPFSNSTMTNEFQLNDASRTARSNELAVTDDFGAAAGMVLLEGRWFGPGDANPDLRPVVINERFAKDLFPGQSALGKRFAEQRENQAEAEHYVVLGVFEDYRSHGDFGAPVNLVMHRFDPAQKGFGVRSITLKMRPGTPREFEASLLQKLKQVRGDWEYTVEPQTQARATQLKTVLIPLAILSVIACFMLIMVGFGLFGVLWQNTARRIPEIGLRRAVGASAAQIYGQIISEQMLLSTLAMLAGSILLVQLPLTGALGGNLDWRVFTAAIVLSMAVIYLISLLCAAYPGWRASRLTPTEALHYE